MFNFAFEIEKNGVFEPLRGWVRPFTDGETLDESLDSGKFTLSMVPRKDPIKPFTRIRITISEDGAVVNTLDRLVINDRATRRRFSNGLYEHQVETIEITKELERAICDNMTVTNYLGHDYTQGSTIAKANVVIVNNLNNPVIKATQEVTPVIFTPQAVGSVIRVPITRVQAEEGTAGTVWYRYRLRVITPSGLSNYFGTPDEWGPEVFGAEDGVVLPDKGNPSVNYSLSEEGTYQFVAECSRRGGPTFFNTINATYSISTVKTIPSYTDWTITDVINRILSAGETRRVGLDDQRFVFDSAQAAEYSTIKAPEFYFTRSSMWDALMTVGGFIHAIPRLVDNNGVKTVIFDKLGQDKQYTGTLPKEAYEDNTLIGDEYCGTVDSPVENILNTTDRIQGAVTEPSAGAFRAINCEQGGIEISGITMTAISEKLIYRLEKLLLRWQGTPYDATPFVYEKSEYDTLSSFYGQTYPYSKGWALVYSIGDNKITGFNTTVETTTAGTLSNNYAIVNILRSLGATIDDNANFANDLQYQITYIPIAAARLAQRKPYLTHPQDNKLFYNQAGNTVESEYYGQRMKGVLARIGNISTRKTYYFKRYADIPKCGEKIGGDYVAVVEKEYDTPAIKATITTTPNFNKLAEYVGINSNYRLFDVSERQSVNRYIHYDESVLISRTKYATSSAMAAAGNAVAQFGAVLNAGLRVSDYPVTACQIQTYNGRNIKGTAEALITVGAGSFACGNALTFYAAMVDNYGAGYQSSDDYSTGGETFKRAQRLVPYSDALGNISQADVAFYAAASVDPFDYPEGTTQPTPPALSSGGYPFDIEKDSREQLSIVYQMHVQAEDESFVIGSLLTSRNPLVTAKPATAPTIGLYYLTENVNMLDDVIDVTAASAATYPTITTDTTSLVINFGSSPSPINATAWAIADSTTGEVYIACNEPIAQGATPETVYLNFIDNRQLKEIAAQYE